MTDYNVLINKAADIRGLNSLIGYEGVGYKQKGRCTMHLPFCYKVFRLTRESSNLSDSHIAKTDLPYSKIPPIAKALTARLMKLTNGTFTTVTELLAGSLYMAKPRTA